MENGNYYSLIIGYIYIYMYIYVYTYGGYIRIMENRMETTIVL